MPGLIAKPVIDMLLVVAEVEAIDADLLGRLGYGARGEYGIPGRRYFVKGDPRSHHLHAFASGAPEIARHLAFRDLLSADEGARAVYANAKRAAARGGAASKAEYQRDKSGCITRLLADAPPSR